MIKIRLSRGGSRNHAMYRIVAIEKEKKGNGKCIEVLGSYDPKKKIVKIEKDKYKKWLSNGAIASPTVTKLVEKS